MIAFAHRGAMAYAPENTIAAFTLALQQGADGLESDTFLSLDGVPVLAHDEENLLIEGRLVPRRGAAAQRGQVIHIRQTPAEDLRRMGVPTMADLYRACGTDFEFSLDVQHPEAALPALAAAVQAGAEARLWLCLSGPEALAGLRRANWQVKLVDSTRRKRITGGVAARARALAAVGADALNMHWTDWTPRLVQMVQGAGLKAFAWDAQTPETLAAAAALGVDALYSNYPDRLVAQIKNIRSGPTQGLA